MSGRGWPNANTRWDLYTLKDLKNRPKSWERSGGNREGQENNQVSQKNCCTKFSTSLYCRFQILALSQQLGSVLFKLLIEETSKTNPSPPWAISSPRRLPAGGCCRAHVESLTSGWEPEWSIPLDFEQGQFGMARPVLYLGSTRKPQSLLFISPHYALGKAYSKSYFIDIKVVTLQR